MLGMTFKLAQQHRLLTAMECPVCRTYMDLADQTAVQAKLFGVVKYGTCCNCGTEIPYPLSTCRNYRRRWRRRHRKFHSEV